MRTAMESSGGRIPAPTSQNPTEEENLSAYLGCACTVFASENAGNGNPLTSCSFPPSSSSRSGSSGGGRSKGVFPPSASAPDTSSWSSTRLRVSSSVGPSMPQVEGVGTLLEVRRLWKPPSSCRRCHSPAAALGRRSEPPPPSRVALAERTDPSRTEGRRLQLLFQGRRSPPQAALPHSSRPAGEEPLYGFVRIKDSDHRFSRWYPLHRIGLRLLLPSHSAGDDRHRENGGSGSATAQLVRASDIIHTPILSSVYTEITPGMARKKCMAEDHHRTDYFDERLRRDGQTPTTIRYLIYAQQYVFSPWYYAPYGLLHHEYDPMGTLCSRRALHTRASGEGSGGAAVVSGAGKEGSRESLPPSPLSTGSAHASVETRRRNDYIRDAYLCPFSLRIFSTLAQLRYEICQYRCGVESRTRATEEEEEGEVVASSLRGIQDAASQRVTPLGPRHLLHPPGTRIYRDLVQGIAVYEVDGSEHVTYSRHLFLLGKSFLEKKLAGYDVHNYFFYVLCLHPRYFPAFLQLSPRTAPRTAAEAEAQEGDDDDDDVWLFAGYFSWEKNDVGCNLACIVTLPCFGMHATTTAHHAGGSLPLSAPGPPRGLGQFMIRLSYELAYRRGHVGSPERPLSDLGTAAYLRYWRGVLLEWWFQHLSLVHRSSERSPSRRFLSASGEKKTVALGSRAEEWREGARDDDKEKRGLQRKRSRHPFAASWSRRSRSRGGVGGPSRPDRPPLSPYLEKKDGRRYAAYEEEEDEEAEEEEAEPPRRPLLTYTMEQVAASAGLEVEDALRAVLHVGLVQWCGEDRCPKWVLPRTFITVEHEKYWKRRQELIQKASSLRQPPASRGMPSCFMGNAESGASNATVVACFIPMWLAEKALSYQTPVDYWSSRDPATYF